MPRSVEPVVFQFEGYDTEARIYWWSIFLLSPAFFGLWFTKLRWIYSAVILWIFVALGLQARIVVRATRVVITKTCYFIPYWRCAASEMDDV